MSTFCMCVHLMDNPLAGSWEMVNWEKANDRSRKVEADVVIRLLPSAGFAEKNSEMALLVCLMHYTVTSEWRRRKLFSSKILSNHRSVQHQKWFPCNLAISHKQKFWILWFKVHYTKFGGAIFEIWHLWHQFLDIFW